MATPCAQMGPDCGGFNMERTRFLVNTDGVMQRLTRAIVEALLPKGLDSARYRACGNAVTVNVLYWLGLRIQMVDHWWAQLERGEYEDGTLPGTDHLADAGHVASGCAEGGQ